MSKPAQMFDHELNPLKGWPSPYAVDCVAAFALFKSDGSTPVANTAYTAGKVVSIAPATTGSVTAGQFVLGLGTPTSQQSPMPIFLLRNGFGFDVAGDDGNIVGAPATAVGATNTGRISGLVASGAYHLESTEFATGSYQAGDLISSDSLGVPYALRITSNGTDHAGQVTICGVASGPQYTNKNGKAVVPFWSVYVPVVRAVATSSSSGSP